MAGDFLTGGYRCYLWWPSCRVTKHSLLSMSMTTFLDTRELLFSAVERDEFLQHWANSHSFASVTCRPGFKPNCYSQAYSYLHVGWLNCVSNCARGQMVVDGESIHQAMCLHSKPTYRLTNHLQGTPQDKTLIIIGYMVSKYDSEMKENQLELSWGFHTMLLYAANFSSVMGPVASL